AFRNAGSVFSGSSHEAPRWAMTSGVTSPEQTLHQLDVDCRNDLVRRRESVRAERAEHGEAAHSCRLRRGDAGFPVLEDDHIARVETAVEERERPQVARRVRFP